MSAVKISEGHDNFFTPLRIIMALMVVFGHATVVKIGGSSAEPKLFLHYTPSYTAVNAFFIVSGFLVTKSMLHRGDMPGFAAARILRIFPALLTFVLITTFAMGAMVTSMPLTQYFTHPETLTQPLRVLSFAQTEMNLPGTFQDNPEQMSGATLWTLRYEVLAYIGTFIAFAIGLLRSRSLIAMQFLIFAIVYPVAIRTGLYDTLPDTAQAVLRFGLAYGLGAAIFAFRDTLRFHLWAPAVFLGLTWLFKSGPEAEVAFNLAIATLVFWLAYIEAPKWKFLQRLDDVSYGIYIYHWAVLQCLVLINPAFNTAALALTAATLSSVIAWLSWRIIEKPALKSKGRLASLLRLKRPANAAATP